MAPLNPLENDPFDNLQELETLEEPTNRLDEMVGNMAMEVYPWLEVIDPEQRQPHLKHLGHGVKAAKNIPKGAVICQYKGVWVNKGDKMEER